MSAFDDAFDVVVHNETSETVTVSMNPKDSGNWSSGVVGKGVLMGSAYGIAAPTAIATGWTKPMSQLTLADAKSIAKQFYWDKIRGDELPPRLATEVFDLAYNSGPDRARRILQRALGVAEDGVFGPATMGAIGEQSEDRLIARLNAHRLLFLAGLKSFDEFGKGWVRRVANNQLRSMK